MSYTNLIAIIFYIINGIKLYSYCKFHLLQLVFKYFELIVMFA